MQVEENVSDYRVDYDKKSSTKQDDISPGLKKSIKDIIKNEGYINYDLDVKVLPADGGNYLATLVEVSVKGRTKKGEKETNLFIKNIIPNEQLEVMFSVNGAYYKEMFAYTELFKIYTKLQDEYNVPKEVRYKIVKSYDESNLEYIILENVAKKGFTTLSRLEAIPLKFAELSVKQLAKFHALSFVLEKRNKEYFNKKIKCLKPGFIFNEDFNKFIDNFSNITMSHVDEKTQVKIKKLIPNAAETINKYQTDVAPVMCLCHGDYRANNIMVKMIDNEITEVIPVDYQILQYGCPLNDFFYFIFGATDQLLRKDHLDDLKDLYHDTLTDFLKYFNMNVEDVFPRKTFDRLYKERMEYGLATAMWFLPIVLAADDDFPDFSKDCPSELAFKIDKSMKPRLEGIVDDFVRWGYL